MRGSGFLGLDSREDAASAQCPCRDLQRIVIRVDWDAAGIPDGIEP